MLFSFPVTKCEKLDCVIAVLLGDHDFFHAFTALASFCCTAISKISLEIKSMVKLFETMGSVSQDEKLVIIRGDQIRLDSSCILVISRLESCGKFFLNTQIPFKILCVTLTLGGAFSMTYQGIFLSPKKVQYNVALK